MEATERFAFGQNWRKFNATLSESQRTQARESLIGWFGDLDGKTFLDVGAGSGLFAAAAAELGADVRAFDFDPAHEGIERGDALDGDYMRSLGEFDVVYSWGALHHTGAMWNAVENTLERAKPGGVALIALYNRPRAAALQVGMKRLHSRAPAPLRLILRFGWGLSWLFARTLVRRQSPVAFVRAYPERNRGMTYWRDVEDWVGGWPFDYTNEGEFRSHLPSDFTIARARQAAPGGCDEYLVSRA